MASLIPLPSGALSLWQPGAPGCCRGAGPSPSTPLRCSDGAAHWFALLVPAVELRWVVKWVRTLPERCSCTRKIIWGPQCWRAPPSSGATAHPKWRDGRGATCRMLSWKRLYRVEKRKKIGRIVFFLPRNARRVVLLVAGPLFSFCWMIFQQKASSKELNFMSAGRGDCINVFLVGALRFYSWERLSCQLNGSIGGGLHTRVRQTWGGGGTAGVAYLMLERKKPPLNAHREP